MYSTPGNISTLKENKRQWDTLGELDPLWAMTGTNRHGGWDEERFFQTGDQQVADVMRDIERIGRPRGREAVLDFGCGVGRLTRAFHARFHEYVGLDISDSLIAKARALHAHLPRARFAVSVGDRLHLPDERFDLVYCWGVLQHVPDRAVVLRLLSEFVRVLRQDGLLIFSTVYHIKRLYRLQPRRRMYALLKKLNIPDCILYNQLKLYPQSVHFIPQSVILPHLHSLGVRVLEVRQDSPPESPHKAYLVYVAR
ncbi:MAG: methyltransferase domain-containing protein [Chloroflexaceae bacterium]